MACHKFTTLPISTAPVTPTTPVTLTTTSENNDTIHPKHAGGRPPNPVWEYFEKEPLPSAGYFSVKFKNNKDSDDEPCESNK
ncbi:unnamed protein product [Rhizophagus irregularis]|nr:unnamed protein product [Rhizophagus irregularis]CAB5160203.1 unnamed protein product [Rhizophagus irregularis]